MPIKLLALKSKLFDNAAVWRELFGPFMATTLSALFFGVCLASGLETARWLHEDVFLHQGWVLSALIPIVIGMLVYFLLFKFGVFLYGVIARFMNKDETYFRITKE
ncbi:MAG: hypothetical protein ACYCS8_00475 [Acidithiobacillus sp.]